MVIFSSTIRFFLLETEAIVEKQVQIIRNCRPRTVHSGRRVYAACALTRWQHLAWNDVMAAILKVWRHIKRPNPSIMRIYLKNKLNNPANFHPDPIWNDGALGYFEDGCPNNKNNKINNKNRRRTKQQ